MNRIDKLFQQKKNYILAIYCTAGYPALEDTINILDHLQESGADMVEIGIPYSDPVADGKVIQHSNKVALQNGMSIKKLFSQLKNCRDKFHLPLILMGYLNPVLQFGIEAFCSEASEAGVDGVILPDLPPREYEKHYHEYFEKYGLHFILLITPETPEERIRYIDHVSKGFIYAISSASTTGNEPAQLDTGYLQRVSKMNLKNPVLVGFGISNSDTYLQVCRHSNGAIIGSAYIKTLNSSEDINVVTQRFLKNILK